MSALARNGSTGQADSPSSPNQALQTMQLLEALRSYSDAATTQDTHTLVDYLKAIPASSPSNTASPNKQKPTPLHLAIRCARVSVVPLILDHRPGDLNARDASGETPLHLACALGRLDIIAVLLSQPDIDDAIKDDEGRTCLERAKSGEVARLVQTSRNQFNQTYHELLAAYANGAGRDQLVAWVQRRRARCIDFSAKVKGTTVLHEAAKRKDIPLLELCVEKGADVLAKDGRGKLPVDSAKDAETKEWFKQAVVKEGAALRAVSGSSLADPSDGNLPVRKGYLEKWTNMAKGYKQRWFVLQNGQLTYYRHQDDEGRASRGTITLNQAKITGLSEDKMKFEISSTVTKYKFYCRADHPLEAIRWVEDLKAHMDPAPTSPRMGHSSQPSLSSLAVPRASIAMRSPSGGQSGDETSFGHSPSGASSIGSPSASEQDLPANPKRQSKFGALKSRAMNRPASNANLGGTANSSSNELSVPSQPASVTPSMHESINPSLVEDTDNASLLTFAGELDDGARPPHEENFYLLATSAKAQVEASESLIDNLSGSQDVKNALRQGLKRLGVMLDEYSDQINDREQWYIRRFERESHTRQLWEENMHQVAAQHEELEQVLQRTAEKGSRRKRELKEVRLELLNSPTKSVLSESTMKGDGSPRGQLQSITTPMTAAMAEAEVEAVSSDEEDDEFFEAVESGNLQLKVDPPLQAPAEQPWPENFKVDEAKKASMNAYKNLRRKLPITVDDRPSVSLWGILKNSIGKDLTKISFPVSFNEPTSMLERMAEDMEFSECLDAAAQAEDSTTRIAYVAAFAMSNYSSTLGRIAKPFNPMLGETFEYASWDKHYRYMSEQVSHHPPISACIGESPLWRYSGEVDARNKFMGKSFEIRPTGVAHCELRIPAERAGADYPKDSEGQPLEHYSWKKVTTNVSNFIMGTPIIDHSGTMTVVNHRTGDKAVLEFKPRGWRAANAREIKGEVFDGQGNKVFDVAGRWNTQLVARRAGSSSTDLLPDAEVPQENAYILLWKNTEKPPNSPFNLTPYAITLNDKNDELTPWLPPTDCRLRPDLHAFESGHFEEANDLKTGLEGLQRKTRQKREAGELPPHKPRWFSKVKDADTGEGYWEPAKTEGELAYFAERFRVGHAKEQGEQAEWQEVDHIFGDFELLEAKK